MTIKYMLENIFSEKDIEWHCKDLDSIAMSEFNVACPFGIPFSEPIIDVKEVLVRGKCISSHKTYQKEWEKVVCLINSNDPNDISKILTIREIIDRLKQFDGELELCSADKNQDFASYDCICAFINVFDETDNHECEKRNMPDNYKGKITGFIV